MMLDIQVVITNESDLLDDDATSKHRLYLLQLIHLVFACCARQVCMDNLLMCCAQPVVILERSCYWCFRSNIAGAHEALRTIKLSRFVILKQKKINSNANFLPGVMHLFCKKVRWYELEPQLVACSSLPVFVATRFHSPGLFLKFNSLPCEMQIQVSASNTEYSQKPMT